MCPVRPVVRPGHNLNCPGDVRFLRLLVTSANTRRHILQDIPFERAPFAHVQKPSSWLLHYPVSPSGKKPLASFRVRPDIQEPSDPLMAQYSIPYAVALAAFNDPFDPETFGAIDTHCDAVRRLSRNTTMKLRLINNKPSTGWGVEMHVKFHDGFTAIGEMDVFDGCPEKPLSDGAFKRKFSSMTRHLGSGSSSELFKRLNQIDMEEEISTFFG